MLVAEGEGRWIEYAGGYSDMVAQRGAGVGPVAMTPPAKAAAKPAEQRLRTARKLGFKEKHALETLPREIEALRQTRDRARAMLDDPSLYARDPNAFAKASAALSETEAALHEAENRWLELEMLREEIEGAAAS